VPNDNEEKLATIRAQSAHRQSKRDRALDAKAGAAGYFRRDPSGALVLDENGNKIPSKSRFDTLVLRGAVKFPPCPEAE
jgi:hypothetical protein